MGGRNRLKADIRMVAAGFAPEDTFCKQALITGCIIVQKK
jgi:hypothetical protein